MTNRPRLTGRPTRFMPIVVVMATLLLAGCFTGQQVSQIDVGMSREQVIGIMGRPDGDRGAGNIEAMTYSNRLMSGWSWDRADYHVVLTSGRVSAYGPGVVRQNSPEAFQAGLANAAAIYAATHPQPVYVQSEPAAPPPPPSRPQPLQCTGRINNSGFVNATCD